MKRESASDRGRAKQTTCERGRGWGENKKYDQTRTSCVSMEFDFLFRRKKNYRCREVFRSFLFIRFIFISLRSGFFLRPMQLGHKGNEKGMQYEFVYPILIYTIQINIVKCARARGAGRER